MSKTVTLDEDKMIEILADWHLDDEVSRREALTYAKRLLQRLKKDARPEKIEPGPHLQVMADSTAYALACGTLEGQRGTSADCLARVLRKRLPRFLAKAKIDAFSVASVAREEGVS